MYGASLDFSGVMLPGVGGGLNASNAVTTDQLKRMNASGKKWAPDASGGLSNHDEGILQANSARREKRQSLVNRNFNENVSGEDAMKEIMGRRKARMESFKELKAKEYSFADDTEMMSMPQPFAMAEGCKCGSCAACRDKKRKEVEFREWDTAKRKALKAGEFAGKFAGPGMSFPIQNETDVAAAWSSVGRTKNPRQVMANIIKIAKEMGLEAGLPDSVKQRLAAGESGLPS
jgi:hypothetical protein